MVLALQIRRAAQARLAQRLATSQQAAQNLLRFWTRTGHKHFREEEEILLPALTRHVSLDKERAVMRMLADHALIRAYVESLEKALSAKGLVGEEVVALGYLLHEHVRLEEDKVFPRIEEVPDEKELRAIGPHLTRLLGKQTAQSPVEGCRVPRARAAPIKSSQT